MFCDRQFVISLCVITNQSFWIDCSSLVNDCFKVTTNIEIFIHQFRGTKCKVIVKPIIQMSKLIKYINSVEVINIKGLNFTEEEFIRSQSYHTIILKVILFFILFLEIISF